MSAEIGPIVTIDPTGVYVAPVLPTPTALDFHRRMVSYAATARALARRALIVLDFETHKRYLARQADSEARAAAVERAHPYLGEDFADHWASCY